MTRGAENGRGRGARPSLPGRYRAVVFDMDGLLLDTEVLWHRAEATLLPRGVAAAKAAGLDCVAVPQFAAVDVSAADHVVDSLEELLA